MTLTRRRFMQWAAAFGAIGAYAPARAANGFRPNLLPSEKAVWDEQVWMAKLGPKYTGNAAHTQFVEFLATEMRKLGLDVARERYTLPRWDAKRWELRAGGVVPVTSYFPYSGQTSAAGVRAPLAFAGTNPNLDLSDVRGRIALVEFRLEDPNVPIKLLHKMTKKQILKEFPPNGYKLVEQFDKLPWQHLMFFQRDDIPKKTTPNQ